MSDIFESWFVGLFWNVTNPDTDVAIKRRVALLAGLSVIAISLLLAFGIVAHIQSNQLLVAIDIGTAFLLLVNLIDAKFRKKYELNILIGISIASILFVTLYVFGGKESTTFIWYYTYPLIACYILGAKRGGIVALLMTLPVFILMVPHGEGSIFADYTLDFELRFLFSYLVVVAFSYLIEKARAKNEAELKHVNLFLEKEVQRRTLEIHKTNRNLIHEIEQRIKVAKKIQLSNESFLTILNSIDASIYVADFDSHEIIFMNNYMIETFGQDFTGHTCFRSFQGRKAPCIKCPKDKILDGNNNPKGVYSWQEKNPITGQWLIRNDRAVRWIDGRVVHLQVAADITRLKEMEEQLVQAQKMESIGNLAGGIAHDFNNILSPIIGWSELLMEDLPFDSPKHRDAREIYNAGMRGRDLIRQILTFSRQSENKFLAVRLQRILKEVLKLGRSTIPSTIELTQEIQSTCETVKANPTQVHQIAMNLITNAYHAVEPTGGKITVTLKEVALKDVDLEGLAIQPGRYAVLSVSDTGPGIKTTDMNRIFDPYFTTKERGKGTGLGLAVVYGIVKEHQGDITAHSEVGKGSTFKVYLPIVKSVEKTTLDNEEICLEESSQRILLVDDEVTNTDVFGLLLQRLGYRVRTFNSSVGALDVFKKNPHAFDLVITDMTMPKMTGEQLSRELFAINPEIPIIIITGYSEKINREKAMAMGAKGFLMKPVAKSDMVRMIQKVLDKEKKCAAPSKAFGLWEGSHSV